MSSAFKLELKALLDKWNAEILAVKDAWDQESITIWATDAETAQDFKLECGPAVNVDTLDNVE